MRQDIVEIKNRLLGLSKGEKKNLIVLSLVIFLLLFSYPMVRSVSTAIFLDTFGAKSSPYVWLYSVLGLSVAVALYNRFQVGLTIHRLFLGASLISGCFLVISVWLAEQGYSYWAYALYVAKEVYIVLLVHSVLGYLNSAIDEGVAKIVYGPLGAIGSMGGLLGGLMTSQLAGSLSVEVILRIGALIVLLAGGLFWLTDHSKVLAKSLDDRGKESPLHSIRGIRGYVLLIASLVIISQFIINLVNFQFNIFLDQELADKVAKTQFLGKLYSGINTFSLVIQFFVIPFVLRNFSVRAIHRSIPLTYFFVFWGGIILGEGVLWPVAVAFAVFKGFDYSLFSVSKEMLYFVLTSRQKYGAKYIVDMVAYRLAKGLISFALIFFQSVFFVKSLIVGFLVLWMILLIPLFYYYKKLSMRRHN